MEMEKRAELEGGRAEASLTLLQLVQLAKRRFLEKESPLSVLAPLVLAMRVKVVRRGIVARISQDGKLYVGEGLLSLIRDCVEKDPLVTPKEVVAAVLSHEALHLFFGAWDREEELRNRHPELPPGLVHLLSNEAHDIAINQIVEQMFGGVFHLRPDLFLLPESYKPPLPRGGAMEDYFEILRERRTSGASRPSATSCPSACEEGEGASSDHSKRAGSSPEEEAGVEVPSEGEEAFPPEGASPEEEVPPGEEEFPGEEEGEVFEREDDEEGEGEEREKGSQEEGEEGEEGNKEEGRGEARAPQETGEEGPRSDLLGVATAEEAAELEKEVLVAEEGPEPDPSLLPVLRKMVEEKAKAKGWSLAPGVPIGTAPAPSASARSWKSELRGLIARALKTGHVHRRAAKRGRRSYVDPSIAVRAGLQRAFGTEEYVLPHRYLEREPRVGIILDTSGSMDPHYHHLLGEALAVIEELRAKEVWVLLNHVRPYRQLRVGSRHPSLLEEISRGWESGGTDLRPGLKRLAELGVDVGIAITDGETPWTPSDAPFDGELPKWLEKGPPYLFIVLLLGKPSGAFPLPDWAFKIEVEQVR